MFGYHKKVKSRDKFDMPVKESLVAILTEVQALLSHDNDGIRTQSVRAIESFCALPNECRPLVESAKESIKNFLKEPHITSGNIVTGLMSLSRLAKSDNSYLSFMVTQYESIHSNLPPTLSVTQVQNVRKIVKIQLLDILRTVPGAQPFHSNIYQASFQIDISVRPLICQVSLTSFENSFSYFLILMFRKKNLKPLSRQHQKIKMKVNLKKEKDQKILEKMMMINLLQKGPNLEMNRKAKTIELTSSVSSYNRS